MTNFTALFRTRQNLRMRAAHQNLICRQSLSLENTWIQTIADALSEKDRYKHYIDICKFFWWYFTDIRYIITVGCYDVFWIQVC